MPHTSTVEADAEGSLAVPAQDPQDQVLSTKEIYLPQREKGHGIRDKDRRQKMRQREKGLRERRQGLCPGK